MQRTAYVTDLLVRAFFIFLVGVLLTRQWWLALLISLTINVVYEITVGKKYWRQFKQQPKRPRRQLKTVLRQLWQRAFARERTKGLVLAGIVLLILSPIVRFRWYYVTVAVVVFSMAAITRFAPPVKSATMPCEPASNPSSRPADCPPPATA